MAWISLVVVQAFIHYFIIGARRERIAKEAEAKIIEESLSYSGDSIESDLNTIPNTPTGEPTAITISYFSSKAVPSAHSIHEVSIDLSDPGIPTKTPFSLTQTGTEVLEVCAEEKLYRKRCFRHPLTYLFNFVHIDLVALWFTELLFEEYSGTTNPISTSVIVHALLLHISYGFVLLIPECLSRRNARRKNVQPRNIFLRYRQFPTLERKQLQQLISGSCHIELPATTRGQNSPKLLTLVHE